jgi:hypothetical protein
MSTDGHEKVPDEEYEAAHHDSAGLPPVDFATFILSIVTSAMVSLGEAKAPDGETHLDLPLARQMIDLIAMLQDKTRGNLSGEEERLINQVLFDLRMKFIEVAGRSK